VVLVPKYLALLMHKLVMVEQILAVVVEALDMDLLLLLVL
jgi:hypothetical protein